MFEEANKLEKEILALGFAKKIERIIGYVGNETFGDLDISRQASSGNGIDIIIKYKNEMVYQQFSHCHIEFYKSGEWEAQLNRLVLKEDMIEHIADAEKSHNENVRQIKRYYALQGVTLLPS